jgi:hypothetical protein
MLELGPFFVNSDNKTLSANKYAWNNGKQTYTRHQNTILTFACTITITGPFYG